MQRHEAIDGLAARGPVIPVLQFDDAEQAVSVCRALAEGGIRTVEITLRTPAALAAIEAVARLGEDLFIGAGTILTPSQLGDVLQAGARFAVSPGFSLTMAAAADRLALPLLPGVMTPSEIMAAREAGYTRLKFFPAEAAGGVTALAALAGPFGDLHFCPTGGIRAENAAAYLALSNVMCVGGSWLAPRDLVAAGDWKGITALARAASGLRPQIQRNT
jgi:2-dehydro-3-deoxyphosphogluconate aldolase / (4S)-4-hydroxy-2-oxoglutarate aldolase